MKNRVFVVFAITLVGMLLLQSCGPVVISPHPNRPPPPWFYPNRVEPVRYVYFPEYLIYYDLSARSYLYLDSNVWVRVNVLPSRYRNIDLRRSKFVRVNGYRGDNIQSYHRQNYPRSPSSSRTSKPRGRRIN